MSGGTITRKDLITDEGLEFGKEYAKNIRLAIEANDDLVDSAKALAQIANSYQKANNSQSFIAAKNEEKLALQRVENAIKAEEAALKSAEKIKQESLRTRKLELDAINKEETAKKRSTKLTVEERVQNEINNRVLKQAALEKLGLVSAYDKLNRSRTEAKNKLRDLIATETASTESIKKAQAEFDKLDAKVKRADKAVGDFTKNVGNYPNLNSFTSGLRDLVGAFGLVGGITAFASVVKGSITTIREFEQSVADLRAITGASGEDLDFLKRNAIEMGKGVKGGAKAVVESYKLIASAKPELLENVNSLNQVTKAVITLSQASGMELPAAATALTDAMNQFGAPAEEAAFFIDALANGAKYGSAEIPEITDALLKFGAVAKSSNISIGESTALIELLAEKGLKGAEAGTALRNVLLKLSAPDALPKDAQKVIQELGIDFEFLKDKTVTVQQKFEALKPLLQDDANLVKVFGLENVVAAKNVIGHTDRLGELTSKMDEFGTAQEQATLRTQTLEGDIVKLGSSWDSFILSLDKGDSVISRSLSNLIGLLNKAIEGYAFLLESDKQQATRLQDQTYNDNLLNSTKAIFENYNQIEKEIKGINDQILKQQTLLRSNPNNQNVKDELQNLKAQKDALKELLDVEKEAISLDAVSALPDLEKRVETINSEIKALESKNVSLQKVVDSEVYATSKYAKASNELKKNEERVKKLTITLGFAKSDVDAYRAAYDKLNPAINENSEETKENTDLTKKNEDAKKAAEKARKDQLARLKKLDDDAFALAKFRMEQEIEISNEIAENEEETTDFRIDAYLNAQQTEIKLAEETAAYKLRQISQYNDDVRDLTKGEIELLIDGGEIKKKLTDDEVLVLEELAAKKENIDKKDLANRQKIIDSIVAIEQKKTDRVLKQQDTELNERLLMENKYFQEELDALNGNQKAIEDATKDHEERVLKIKKEAIEEGLRAEIEATKKLLENSNLSADVKAGLLNKLSKLELDLNQISVDSTIDTNEKKLLSEEEYAERIGELSQELAGALIDLTNALFDARIQRIDEDIQRNDEYYARQIELAGNDTAQKELLQREADKKREELEKKKKKEQQKQAIFNKALTITEIGLKTAQAVVAALAVGPPQGYVFAALSAAIGVAQLAAAIATPIPKYEKGTKGRPHKGGPAEVGEKRPEVIMEPGKNPYIVSKPTILDLPKGTEVIPSIGEWEKMQRASIMASLDMEANKAKNYQGADAFNARYDAELLEELRRNTEATKKNKSNVVIQNNIDLGHEIWKLSNIKWNA
jgi:TP901 family phage tail tape measure protein